MSGKKLAPHKCLDCPILIPAKRERCPSCAVTARKARQAAYLKQASRQRGKA